MRFGIISPNCTRPNHFTTKFSLREKFYALQMAESTSMIEHINFLNTLFSQLTLLGYKIGVQECVELLLQNLPDAYDQLIINLMNNILMDLLVFNDVTVVVLEEEN